MTDTNPVEYDAILLLSFGGPEAPEDVMPFLENVLRGRNVPRERMLEVAEHYHHFGGVSPINQHCRDLLQALRVELDANGIDLPLYWGNRNWHPYLTDTLRSMQADGIQRALAFVTSSYSSYSGCRQYRENVIASRAEIGDDAPHVDKLRVFYNHPDFIAATIDRLQSALNEVPAERRADAKIAFTAHSIPSSMSAQCDYVQQLMETARLATEPLAIDPSRWQLVYQSRSGPPQVPWLDPDICDHLKALHAGGTHDVVIAPIGFLSDHMEVLFDLDEEARQVSAELGLNMVRAGTVGLHPRFVTMIRKLIQERIAGARRECVGCFGPSHDVCPVDCCPAPQRR